MIFTKQLAIAAFIFIAVFPVILNGQTRSRADTQEWNDVQFYAPVTKTVDFVLYGTLRLGRNVSHSVDERIGAGFSFKFGKYLTLAPFYLHIRTQPFAGTHVYENRLNLAGTLRFPLGHFTVSDRNLFERRLRHPGGDSTRYRNRLQIDHPVKLGDVKLNVFAADEVFYDWSFNAWVRNRFSAGISKAWNKQLTTDLYYLRQNDGHSRPGDLHVIGTTFRIRL
ncbi:MAG TPA: DUF2490 domain-containing protein [Pyrinomonadaceae bacterium]|nr:DUF2490 domain-containing protein [Pyrinomonadaceae bacterium]